MPEAAHAEALRALRLDSANTSLYRLFGEVLLAQGDLPGAMQAFRDGIKIDPSDIACQVALGDSLLAMERGEVHGHSAGLANITSAKPEWLREGKVRIVLQFGAQRLPELPDVPTAVEMASSDLDRDMLRFYALKYDMAYSIISPPGVPADRLAALRHGFNETMRDPAYIEAAKRVALPLNAVDSDEIQTIIARVAATPEPVVQRLRDILDGIGKK